MKKIFINIIRNVYKSLSFKLNKQSRLRRLIYKLYEIIRLVEFKVKSILFKESTLNNITDTFRVNGKEIRVQCIRDFLDEDWNPFLKWNAI